MQTLTPTKQTNKTHWVDEAGNKVPFKSLTKAEKENDKLLYQIAMNALRINAGLKKFKVDIAEKVERAIANFQKEYKGKKTEFKGSYTFYSFDYTTRVKVKVSKPIRFDDLMISQAKDLLNEFLNEDLTSKTAGLKEMVMDAFETSTGKLDVKKILGLQRYADRIPDKRYAQAMEMIKKAIRRPNTCVYYDIALRLPNGKYETIKMALSHI